MRVLVYEHLCTLPGVTSLRAEGWAMLSAALADLAVCADVVPVTLVEPSLVERVKALSPGIAVQVADETEQVFPRLARGCAFALIIAPEFDDILATRCEWAVEAGCKLLGPSPEAVRLCADKLRLAEVLHGVGIAVAPTVPYRADCPPADGYPYVVKPRTGAGTTATFLARSAADFRCAGAAAVAQGYEGELIVQPYLRGIPGSVAVLWRTGWPLTLTPTRQLIETTGPTSQLRYVGGTITYPIELGYEIIRARGAASCLPGVAGYVGVDLIDAGWESIVLEINPRLTTSYVGLRRLSNVNLMQVLLDVVQGKEPPPLSWRSATVRFDPDGTVHEQGE